MAHKRHGVSHVEKALNIYGIILILWSFYRFYFKFDMPMWIDEFVAKPAIFITPVYFFVRKYEKQSFFKALHLHTDSTLGDIVAGLLIGSVFFIAAAISARMHVVNTSQLWMVALVAMTSSICEQLVATGFVLNRLYDSNKSLIRSAFTSSILFFLLRVPILFIENHLRGMMLLETKLTSLVLSLVISILFLRRRSLIYAIMIQFMYAVSYYLFIH